MRNKSTKQSIVARMRRLYKTGIGLTTEFIGSHTVTITVYTLYNSLQFTITLAESSHCIFTGCLSSNITGSVRLQLFSEDCCSARIITRNCSHSARILTRLALQDWTTTTDARILTNWRSSLLYIVSRGPLLWHDITRHLFVVPAPARASAMLFTSLSAILLTSHSTVDCCLQQARHSINSIFTEPELHV
jgi:hypothetical protein